MESEQQSSPLIVIVGPTASGKSVLAINIARLHNGELICADSRTVYKGMDIGTAKPSKEEQRIVAHHVLDVVSPDETFTAARFKDLALAAIKDITSRGKLPIIVGGTGLYIDGVIFDFAFMPPVEQEDREQLNSLSINQLHSKLIEQHIPLPENFQNKRHLVRALETNGLVPIKKGLRSNTLLIGIDIERAELEKRVHARLDKMIENGLEQEVKSLAEVYGWDAPGLSAVGYREWGNVKNTEDTIQLIKHATMQYAKRQRTWFRRNPHIKWIKNSAEAEALVKSFLQQ